MASVNSLSGREGERAKNTFYHSAPATTLRTHSGDLPRPGCPTMWHSTLSRSLSAPNPFTALFIYANSCFWPPANLDFGRCLCTHVSLHPINPPSLLLFSIIIIIISIFYFIIKSLFPLDSFYFNYYINILSIF